MNLVLISNQIENTMKKTYIVPEIEIIKISSMNVLATSIATSSHDEAITGQNKDEYIFNSNSFHGGLFGDDEE